MNTMTTVRRVGAAMLLCAAAACQREGGPGSDSARRASGGPVECYDFIMTKWEPAAMVPGIVVVSPHTQGMTSKVRWAVSPDSASMIAYEDATGAESDPAPDGVVFANERTGRAYQIDSVWSAAPSPDWNQVMYGRASVSRGEGDSVKTSAWEPLAKELRVIAPKAGITADSLAARSRVVSGMSGARGVSVALIAYVAMDSAKTPVQYLGLGGWSVAWRCDASLAKAANAPPAEAKVAWVNGPELRIDAALPADTGRTLKVRGRTITASKGMIVSRDSTGAERKVGPGIPLAATRGGHFVLAVAPRTGAKPHQLPDQAVVYRVP